MNEAGVETLAERLLQAQLRREPVPAPSSSMELDEESAYDVHWGLIERKLERLNLSRCGYKLGMTEHDAARVGGPAPIYGVLMDDCLLSSDGLVHAGELMQPYVEAEIGIRPRTSVPPGATPADVADISELCLVIEVPDCRYAFDYWPGEITATDLVCDQSCVGRVALGETTIDGTEIESVLEHGLELSRDGEVIGVSDHSARVGPMDGVAWLARVLDERDQRIEAGWIVSTGRLVRKVISATPGSTFVLRCPALGEVRLRVS